MSNKKFYKTTIKVDIYTEDDPMTTGDVQYLMDKTFDGLLYTYDHKTAKVTKNKYKKFLVDDMCFDEEDLKTMEEEWSKGDA